MTKKTMKKGKIKVIFKPSTKPEKKYMAIFYNGKDKIKTTHFGAAGMSDYTKHKDPERIKEVQARINFYQNSYDIVYRMYGDEAYFFLESDSFEDAHERMGSFVKQLTNIFQMDVSCTSLIKNQKSLVELIGTNKLE